jgi:hypothetical protein
MVDSRRLANHLATLGILFGPDSRYEDRIEQIREAIATLQASKKPLKFNRIAESFRYPTFRGTEAALAELSEVKRTRFKGKTYYEWTGPRG